MSDLITTTFFAILAAGFLVGVVVGLTGMGGGALMTPALIFLGVGDAATVVTADLTAAAVYKSGGAVVHHREGSPNMRLAMWLVVGSVPMALLGPHLVAYFTDPANIDDVLKMCIGFALLFAAATYAARLYIGLRRERRGVPPGDPDPYIRPIPTILVGAFGGLLVGITSVGSGSVIMISLLILYPGLSAVKLVGTDLVQAVPLVLAAAISNIALHGLDFEILIPLIIGSLPGTILGSKIAPRVPAVGDPPRHRDRADHVGRRAARQGRLGPARRGRGRHPPDAGRRRRRGDAGAGADHLGSDPPHGGPADVRLRRPSPSSRTPYRPGIIGMKPAKPALHDDHKPDRTGGA